MFLQRLISLCELRNTTISAAVKAAGGNTGSIDGWKKKGSIPRAELIASLADHLGTTTDYLLCRTDDPSPVSSCFHILNSDEERMIDTLRRAEPPVRSAVYRMVDAALCEQTHESKLPSPSFLGRNDGIGSHKKRRAKGLKRVEGNAAAGKPITAVRDGERVVSVPTKYLSDRFFIVCAQGDSMIDAGINDGDFCVFQKDAYQDVGRIMLVQIDGATNEPDVTIKRVFFHGDQVELRSENEAYKPMFYPASDVSLVGVLVAIVTPENQQ